MGEIELDKGDDEHLDTEQPIPKTSQAHQGIRSPGAVRRARNFHVLPRERP
jgi:hypothetical protein